VDTYRTNVQDRNTIRLWCRRWRTSFQDSKKWRLRIFSNTRSCILERSTFNLRFSAHDRARFPYLQVGSDMCIIIVWK